MQPYGRSMFFADRASAWIGLEQDGTMVIRAGVTDLGAGQAASLANIAGEILGVTVDRTSVHIGDSHLTPLTGGTFATRQLYMSGNATVKVATALRDKLAPIAADLLGCEESELEWANNRVGVTGDRARSVTMAELSRTAEARDVMPYCHETFNAEAGEFDPETGPGPDLPGLHPRLPRGRRRGRRAHRARSGSSSTSPSTTWAAPSTCSASRARSRARSRRASATR